MRLKNVLYLRWMVFGSEIYAEISSSKSRAFLASLIELGPYWYISGRVITFLHSVRSNSSSLFASWRFRSAIPELNNRNASFKYYFVRIIEFRMYPSLILLKLLISGASNPASTVATLNVCSGALFPRPLMDTSCPNSESCSFTLSWNIC